MAEADRDDLISIIDEEDKTTEIPTTLPLLPVRDVVIFTDMLLPLFVGREKSVRAVEEAVGGPGFVFLATQKDAAIENPSTDEIYHTGTVGRVLRILKLPDGRVKVLVQGVAKGTISKFMRKRAPYRVKIDLLPEPPVEEKVTLEVEALMRNVREQSEKILALRGELTNDVTSILQNVDDPGKAGRPGRLQPPAEDRGVPGAARNPGPGRAAEAGQRRALAGTRTVGDAGQDPVRRQGRDFEEPAGLLPARAGAGHLQGARGARRPLHRNRRVREKDQKGQDAEGGEHRSPEAAQTPRSDAPGLGRVHGDPFLPGLAGGAAVEQIHPGRHRHPQGAGAAGPRALRSARR